MSFIDPPKQQTSHHLTAGNPNADIVFILDSPNRDDLVYHKLLSSYVGQMFDHCLHQAGLVRAQQYVICAEQSVIYSTGIDKYVKKNNHLLTELGEEVAKNLQQRIQDLPAKIFIPMGKLATACLTGSGDVSARRGYLTYWNEKPVLPTLAPSSASFGGNYINKYYIIEDIKKAVKIKEKLDYDECECIYPTTLEQIAELCEKIKQTGSVSFDIEVANYEVSAISFSMSPEISYAIPFAVKNLWTPWQEVEVWNMLNDILASPEIAKTGQNLIFDIHFLMQHQHIFVRGTIYDTMIAHHIAFPDFLKGLGFLASIYCHVPYWKDMVSFKNIKKES